MTRKGTHAIAKITASLITASLLLTPVTALAETMTDLQQSYKEASDSYQSLLVESDAASEQLNDARVKLDKANTEAKDARAKYNKATETLSKMVKAEYVGATSSMNTVSIVLGTKNISSLITALNATETVSRRQAEAVNNARDTKERLNRAFEQASTAVSEAKAAKDELDAKASEAETYMNSLSDGIRNQIESDTQGGMSSDTNVAQSLIDYYSRGGTYPKNPAATTTQDSTVTEEQRRQILIAALSKVGKTTYSFGASGPDAYDCSGLVQYAYAAAGLQVPHSSSADRLMCDVKPISELEAGDMVFWNGHVAIYAGNGQTIESMPGRGVVMFRIWGQPLGGGQPY